MRKKEILCVCACLTLGLTGCTAGDLIDQYMGTSGETTMEETAENTQRVYMDEVSGTLLDFTGNKLTLLDSSEDLTYVFDVSQATLECAEGIISGDEISVIYEGQLTDTDTSTVKALKVVDDYHKTTGLADNTASGTVVSLTPNTLTLRSGKKTAVTYPITGARQYYQGGIAAGSKVTLHFKGEVSSGSSGAKLIKVMSISDTEPFAAPEPTPTPEAPQTQTTDSGTVKQFQASIQNVSANVLQVIPSASEKTLDLDMTGIPCYFPGGLAVGSNVTVFYTGTDFSGETLNGMTITAITGDNPDDMDAYHMNFSVSGTIVGSTANTITLQTSDGVLVTCFTEDAQNSSTGGLLSGSSVSITFNPAEAQETNILTSIKITDA